MDSFEKKDLSDYVLCSKNGTYFVGDARSSMRKIQVFWNVMPCCGVFPDVSRHRSAFVSGSSSSRQTAVREYIVLYSTGLFKMTVGVLTNCHTQYT